MAIVIEANYSKKLGLPEYSSHQYSVTLRTEVSDLSKVQEESDRLYHLLQGCVDHALQNAGFIPQSGTANETRSTFRNGDNGKGHPRDGNGNGSDKWNCTEKQRELITKIVDENRLAKPDVENIANQLFGKSVRALNKLEASGFIEELFRHTGANGNGKGNRRYQPAGAR